MTSLTTGVAFQEPTGYAVGMDLISCMGHWVTYLYKCDKLHIDLLIWIVDRILTGLPHILSRMSNKGIYHPEISR